MADTISLVFSTILLNLIVFFLPTQLGLHFWPDFARAAGIKIDYFSPTLYLTDLLIISYLVISAKKLSHWFGRHSRGIIVFLTFASLNIGFGLSPFNSLFWWLRLSLYLLFFLSLRLQKVTWSQIKTPLILSTIIIIILEILQTQSQHSLGGIFYWLGERSFDTSTSGLARIDFFGRDFVRAPSVFSHPNSLAGYLLAVYYLLHFHKSPLWQRIIVFIGLLLTFSKGALLAFLLVISLQINSSLLITTTLFLSLTQLFITALPGNIQFITDRLFLLLPTKSIIFNSPFIGVGLGNFVNALTTYLPGSSLVMSKMQPVHNLPLLVASEIGILGIFLLIFGISRNLKKITRPGLFALLAIVLITGVFDHYWWTLPQNKLIFLLAAAIML